MNKLDPMAETDGGSKGREATSLGASSADRPPLGGTAPSGGSAVREATSVGAMYRDAGREPMLSSAISRIGVALKKYSVNPGVS